MPLSAAKAIAYPQVILRRKLNRGFASHNPSPRLAVRSVLKLGASSLLLDLLLGHRPDGNEIEPLWRYLHLNTWTDAFSDGIR